MAKLQKHVPLRECGYALVNDDKFEEALANKYLNFDKTMMCGGWDTKQYCLFQMKKYDESFAILDRRLTFAPDDRYALMRKALHLSQIGRHKEALRVCNKFIIVAKKSNKIHRVFSGYGIKAHCLYNAEKYRESIIYYKKSLKAKPLRRYLVENAERGIEKCMKSLGVSQMK